MYSNRLLTGILVLTILVSQSLTTAQATVSPKKISIYQAEKNIDKAIKKTILWQRTNPFTASIVNEDDVERTVDTYTVDKAGNVRIADSEGTILIEIGKNSYAPFIESVFFPFEIDIARKIGLDLKLKWVKVKSVTVNGIYDPNFSRDQARAITSPHITMFESIYPNHSVVTSLKNGKSETIKVSTKAFSNTEFGAVPSSTLTLTITDGLLTSYNFKSKGLTTNITYKPFKGILTPPKDPILIWDTVLNYPEYAQLKAEYNGRVTLDWLLDEAKAIAKLAGRTDPNTEDWVATMGLASSIDANLYDKGIGFLVLDDNRDAFLMCGEFTASKPILRTSSCDELGFVKA